MAAQKRESPANPMWNLTSAQWRSLFGWTALALWVGILFATLFPFDFRLHNDVSWLEGGGLRFGRHGIVFSGGPMMPPSVGEDASCSLELLLRPASTGAAMNTIVAFSADGRPGRVQLTQWRSGIVVWREYPEHGTRNRPIKRDAGAIFNSGQPVLLTLASGPKGVSVYSNGQLLERFPGFMLSRRAMGGEIALGSDPVHMEPWSGEIRGLALYDRELKANEVAEHSRAWMREQDLQCERTSGQTALFTFREGSGALVQNLCPGGPDLSIPATFQLPLKAFLARPWKEFSASWDYVNDVLRNIIGFLPFGFALCLYLLVDGRTRHPLLLSILAGAATSAGIEFLQVFIPQRESGMTDILTNSLGMALGAYVARGQTTQQVLEKFAGYRFDTLKNENPGTPVTISDRSNQQDG